MSHAQTGLQSAQNYQLQTADRPESAFTSRIRGLATGSQTIAERLDRILTNLRGPAPPAPAQQGSGSVRQSCIEDYLGHCESTHKNIEDTLSQIEGLIG